jgi:hypothetical protein
MTGSGQFRETDGHPRRPAGIPPYPMDSCTPSHSFCLGRASALTVSVSRGWCGGPERRLCLDVFGCVPKRLGDLCVCVSWVFSPGLEGSPATWHNVWHPLGSRTGFLDCLYVWCIVRSAHPPLPTHFLLLPLCISTSRYGMVFTKSLIANIEFDLSQVLRLSPLGRVWLGLKRREGPAGNAAGGKPLVAYLLRVTSSRRFSS